MLDTTSQCFDNRMIVCTAMIFNSIVTGEVDVFVEPLLVKYDVSNIKNLTFRQVYLFVLDNITTDISGELVLTDLAFNQQTLDLIEALEFLMQVSRTH